MAIINTYPTATPKGADLLIGTQVKDDTIEENSTKSFTVSDVAALALNYKAYVFSFSQTGTNDPVVTELQNNTGLTFTFTRNSAGVFFLVPSSSIDVSKAYIQLTGGNSGNETIIMLKDYSATRFDIVNIDFGVGPVDNVGTSFVELRIYN